jgi:hypothetical protein
MATVLAATYFACDMRARSVFNFGELTHFGRRRIGLVWVFRWGGISQQRLVILEISNLYHFISKTSKTRVDGKIQYVKSQQYFINS